MNAKSATAAIAAVSATLALSANAFAGELYGGIDNGFSNAGSSVSSSIIQTSVATFGGGELYTAANQALEDFEASEAPKPAYVTTLALGGELGAPATGNQVFPSDTALAE